MRQGDKVPEGDRAEALAARMLEAQGIRVEVPPRRDGPWDLKANGHKVDVKSATHTTSKGADGYPIKGYVFANLHPSPTSDFYLLLCLSQDRREVLRYYLVPAAQLKQQTLTLTEARTDKMTPYLSNLAPLKTLKKTAALVSAIYPEAADRQFRRSLVPITPAYSHDERLVVRAAGAAAGALTLDGVRNLVRYSEGSYEPSNTRKFVAVVAVGAAQHMAQQLVDQARARR